MKKNGLIKVLPLFVVAFIGLFFAISCEKETNTPVSITQGQNVEKWVCSDSSWFGRFTIYLDIYPDDSLMYTYYGYMDSNIGQNATRKYFFMDNYWYKYHYDTTYYFPGEGNNTMFIDALWEQGGSDTTTRIWELFSVNYLDDSIMYMAYHRHNTDLTTVYNYYFKPFNND